MTKSETQLLTVDALIIYMKDKIVLIPRKNPAFQGELALPVDLLISERQFKKRALEKPMNKQILN